MNQTAYRKPLGVEPEDDSSSILKHDIAGFIRDCHGGYYFNYVEVFFSLLHDIDDRKREMGLPVHLFPEIYFDPDNPANTISDGRKIPKPVCVSYMRQIYDAMSNAPDLPKNVFRRNSGRRPA